MNESLHSLNVLLYTFYPAYYTSMTSQWTSKNRNDPKDACCTWRVRREHATVTSSDQMTTTDHSQKAVTKWPISATLRRQWPSDNYQSLPTSSNPSDYYQSLSISSNQRKQYQSLSTSSDQSARYQSLPTGTILGLMMLPWYAQTAAIWGCGISSDATVQYLLWFESAGSALIRGYRICSDARVPNLL